MDFYVDLTWDKEAGVWVATSKDIPGLVLEADTYEAIIDEVRGAAPALIEENVLGRKRPCPVNVHYRSEFMEQYA